MAEPKELANKARTDLAQALEALQSSPDVPEQLLQIAEPIAATMGILHRIERTGQAEAAGCNDALQNVRGALNELQAVAGQFPAVDQAMEAVAGSLSKLFALNKSVGGGPMPAAAQAEPQAPAPQPAPQPVAAQPVAQPAPQPVAAQPAPQPVAAQPAPQPVVAQPAPQPVAAQPVAAQPVAQPVAAQPVAQPAPQPVAPQAAPQPVAPQAGFPAGGQPLDQTALAGTPQMGAPAQAQPADQLAVGGTVMMGDGSGAAAAAVDDHVPGMTNAPPPPEGAEHVDVELGAHSTSNFYKGLSGNDVIDHGGIFVGTYKIPKINKPVRLRILLPGDLEFIADAIVQWTRETRSGESEPGFGAKFTRIPPEGRKLVYRYVRNREPMFYDDM